MPPVIPPKAGPEQKADILVELLKHKFCRNPESYFLWGRRETIAYRTGLTESQAKRWLGYGKKFNRILTFRGRNAFCRWLEMVGGPDYGLKASDGFRPACYTLIVVLLDRLPARVRPEGLLGPLGLPEPPSFGPEVRHQMAQDCPIKGGKVAPSHLKAKEEEMTNRNTPGSGSGSVSSHDFTPEPDPPCPQERPRETQTTIPPQALAERTWETLSETEQASRLAAAAQAIPAPFRGRPNAVLRWAINTLAEELPPVPVVVQPTPAVSNAESLTPRQELEREIAALVVVDPESIDHEAQRVGHLIAKLLGEPNSYRTFRKRCFQVATRDLKPNVLIQAVRYAHPPGDTPRAIRFNACLKRLRKRAAAG